MKILLTLILLPRFLFGFANIPISTDSRIRILIYREDSIYSLKFLPETNARIKFVKNERIRSIMIGDRSNWELKVMDDNCLYIRPLRSNLKTNMIIDTDKRSYIIDLESSDAEEDALYLVQFIDPTEESYNSKESKNQQNILRSVDINRTIKLNESVASPTSNLGVQQKVEIKNTKYTYAGSKDLVPIVAFDNGEKTFFKFQDNIAPVIYEVDATGKENLLNLKIQNGYFVFDGIKKQFSLRIGNKLACVFNE